MPTQDWWLVFKTKKEGNAPKELNGDLKNLNQGLADTIQGMTGFSLSSLGVAGAVVAIGSGMKKAIDAASDMNETVSKSRVVFGATSDEIEKMGDTAARSMGISKQEAIAAAATYGNLFTAMGMGAEQSAKMSINLVKLASDLASFNNIPVAEALDKIRAGLVGESEPLKSLGININEAALKQEALNLGLSDGKATLDAATKAQAAYSLMLKQSTSAQGDFARTADGVANKQRIIEATTKDLTASIGEGLLPAWQAILGVWNDTLGTADHLVNDNKRVQQAVEEHKKEIWQTIPVYEDYIVELVRAGLASQGIERDSKDLKRELENVEGGFEHAREANGGYTEAQYDSMRAAEAFGSMIKIVATEADANGYLVEDAANRQKEAYQQLAAVINGDLAAANKVLKEQATIIKNSVDNSFKPFDIELFNSQALAGTTGDAYKSLSEALGKYFDPALQNLWKQLGDANAEFQKTGDLEKYKAAVLGIRDAFAELQYTGFHPELAIKTTLTIAGKVYNSYTDYIAALKAAAGQDLTDKTVTITTQTRTVKYGSEGPGAPVPETPGGGTSGTPGGGQGAKMMANQVAGGGVMLTGNNIYIRSDSDIELLARRIDQLNRQRRG